MAAVSAIVITLASGVASGQPGAEPASECTPPCRPGYGCVDGRCRNPCNPDCAPEEVCTRAGRCIPATPPAPPVAPAPSTRRAPTDAYVEAGAGYGDPEPVDETPGFLLLFDPGGMLFEKLVYDYLPLSCEIVFAGDSVGLSLQPMYFIYEEIDNIGGGVIGLRVMPMARGVEGFHLQFMIGGVTAPAFVSAFSIGYTWVHKPFALGLAGHLVYMYIDVGGGTHAVAAAPGITIGFGG